MTDLQPALMLGKDPDARGKTPRLTVEEAARNTPSAARLAAPSWRLGYSLQTSKTFVEVLGSRTGEVLRRFPAGRTEFELRALANGEMGLLLNRVA